MLLTLLFLMLGCLSECPPGGPTWLTAFLLGLQILDVSCELGEDLGLCYAAEQSFEALEELGVLEAEDGHAKLEEVALACLHD